MKWSRDGAHVLFSDDGYKIARFRVAENTYYRPSLKGDFISAPLSSADEAKVECQRHFEGGGK